MLPSFETVTQPVVKKFNGKKRADVNRAEFGEGYSQRSKAGINAVAATLQLQWLQKNEDIDAIDAFLEARGGVEAFLYRLPHETEFRIWTCAEWGIADAGPNGIQLNATFRQEFDIV